MRMKPHLTILLVVLVLGCRSTRQDATRSEGGQQEQMKPADPGPGIPPDHCRIVGTIVAVTTAMGSNSDDPCSKAPCIAVVKVDEILGYGTGFEAFFLSKGKEISVQFRYTLGSTKDLFPRMSPSLPGLSVGSKFQADLQAVPMTVTSKAKSVSFVVGDYRVL